MLYLEQVSFNVIILLFCSSSNSVNGGGGGGVVDVVLAWKDKDYQVWMFIHPLKAHTVVPFDAPPFPFPPLAFLGGL